MKTMIFWLRKRCKNAKMRGLATAADSAAHIVHMSRAAHDGDGRLFVVDAPNACAGRVKIAMFLDGTLREGMTSGQGPISRPCVVAIGVNACMAIAGATEAARNWDARLRRDGTVKVKDTTALGPRSDGVTAVPADWFGREEPNEVTDGWPQ